jgi:hypothetical protein
MSKNDKNKTYVTLSQMILETHLSAGAKITYAHLLSLSKNLGYAYSSTKKIAASLKFQVRTTQKYLKEIIDHVPKLTNYKYKGQKRIYTPIGKYFNDYMRNDMKVIITDDIINNATLTPVYKIAHGYLVARGLNLPHTEGYNWDSMVEVASYMGVSVSTAYRYINKLLDTKTLKRDKAHYLMFITLDNYSKEQRRQAKEIESALKQDAETRDSQARQHKIYKMPIDEDVSKALDRAFENM